MSLLIFLFAGFQTTSVTLSYCVYYLAKYPEEMVKLQAEIDALETVIKCFITTCMLKINFICIKDHFDYDNIQRLHYLDLFIKEIQRINPIGNG